MTTVQGIDALIAIYRVYHNSALAQCAAAEEREVIEGQDKMENILVEARASVQRAKVRRDTQHQAALSSETTLGMLSDLK